MMTIICWSLALPPTHATVSFHETQNLHHHFALIHQNKLITLLLGPAPALTQLCHSFFTHFPLGALIYVETLLTVILEILSFLFIYSSSILKELPAAFGQRALFALKCLRVCACVMRQWLLATPPWRVEKVAWGVIFRLPAVVRSGSWSMKILNNNIKHKTFYWCFIQENFN